MASRTSYRGIISKSKAGKNLVFWGSVTEISNHIGLNYRATLMILSGATKSSRTGWRVMTEQEQILYFQVRPEVVSTRKNAKYEKKQGWKLTFLKDWKKGQPYNVATEQWSGTPQEFCRMSGCNQGVIYRHINTHRGLPEAYPCKSIRGWTIARIRENAA